MSKFTLASLIVADGVRPAVCVGDDVFLFSEDLRAVYQDLKAVFCDWDKAFPRLQSFADACGRGQDAASLGGAVKLAAADATFDLPVRFPNKLIGVGANFNDHLAEMGLPEIRFDPMPIFFMPPTTCMVGPGRTVEKPKTTKEFDWEIELTIVIGKKVKDATEEEARAAIAGYTISLDMSARDLIQIGPPFYVDLVRGKAQDTMAPCGPVITPTQFMGDIKNLDMKLWVNGQLRQDSSTKHMIFSVEEIVSHVSKYVTLEPGDFVTTGSPAGSGVFHNYFLKDGDQIRAFIENIGDLEVEIIDPAIDHGLTKAA